MKKTINRDSGKSPVIFSHVQLLNYLKMSMKLSMLLLFIEGFNSLLTSTVLAAGKLWAVQETWCSGCQTL